MFEQKWKDANPKPSTLDHLLDGYPAPTLHDRLIRDGLITLIIFGFGTVLLYPFDLQFKVLAFMEPVQPFAGLIMGALGAWGLYERHRRMQ